MLTGYLHPGYAESLKEFGRPRELPHCGGWILERHIPDTNDIDAMGCYPIFACQNWTQLNNDINTFYKEWVSISVVSDPFGDYDISEINQIFDFASPFKDHFIVDLEEDINNIVSKSHRDTVRRTIKNIDVSHCPNPILYLEKWIDLYGYLVKRHNISGIRAFSREAFTKQLTIPGLIMFKAEHKGEIIGLDLWYVQGDIAYGHLVALNPLGYELRASYALKWFLIQYFKNKVKWLDLGGGAGINNDGKDGLSEFKRGWATGTKPVYFCGKVFDRDRYDAILKAKGITTESFFPAYRKGEF